LEIIKTKLEGCVIIQPQLFRDERGYFAETFHHQKFADAYGKEIHFVQDNQSQSSYGTLRGLHYQKGASAQSKLIRVIQGEVLDVAVDIRQHSPTFGEHVATLLSGENFKQMFIPKGFAHGFVCLSETAVFAYKCDAFYDASAEAGILYKDSQLHIDWRLPEKDIIISEKDKKQPLFNSLYNE